MERLAILANRFVCLARTEILALSAQMINISTMAIVIIFVPLVLFLTVSLQQAKSARSVNPIAMCAPAAIRAPNVETVCTFMAQIV